MSIKKAIIFIPTLTLVLLAALPPLQTSAAFNSVLEKQKTYSDILLLVSDLEDGTVIFEKNADVKTAPASLSKIVVASIVLEKCENLEEKVQAPAYAIHALANTGSSNVGIKPGEIMTVSELLYCLLVASANDAANVLGHHVAGSVEDFVPLMNDYVKGLGCMDTVFKNVHGLDEDGQYTTAKDVVIYTKAALKNPIFEEITSSLRHTIAATNLSPQRHLNTTVLLMNRGIPDYYYEYASGIKTGSTKQAGRCVVSRASKDGYSYMAVVMKAEMINIDDDAVLENCSFIDTKTMYKWAFDNIRLRSVVSKHQVIGELPVKLSWQADYIQLLPKEDYRALMPSKDGEDSVLIEVDKESLPAQGFIKAPIKKGDLLAEAKVLYAGEEVSRIELVAANDLKLSKLKFVADQALQFTKTFIFKIIAILLSLVFLFFLIFFALQMKKKAAKRKLRVVRINPGKGRKKK
ncbi:MAG: D-alanyl-D-alanine carboxypeptidase [Clostridiales bacterium]|nr:D-alanyl-D-alanine carboxypeptidase [Clostridiales bacterium]